MKAHLKKFCPDLRTCELENRLVPAVNNPGAIVLTPVGYVLLSPSPGIAASPGGVTGSTAILTSPAITGLGNVSGVLPGNSAGVLGVATTAPTRSNRGVTLNLTVGSGADDASAPVAPRKILPNDLLNTLAIVARVSGDRSPVLPPGQIYQGGVPVTARVGVATRVPGASAGWEPDERPADPLRIRPRKPAHRLASDASGDLVISNADRAP